MKWIQLKVSDIMGPEIIGVSPDTPIEEAVQKLFDNNISSLAIKKRDKMIGIVTERDFTRCIISQKKGSKVKDIMSSNLISIDGDEDLLGAVRMMGKHNIRHLLVKKKKEYVGIISLRDILKIEPNLIYGYNGQMQRQD